MVVHFRSFQAKLLFSFLVFLLLTGSGALINFWFFQRLDKLSSVTSNLDNILVKTLQTIKVEKDFFSHGTLDAHFYETGESEYLAEHARLMEEIRQNLDVLTHSEEVQRFDIDGNAARLQNELKGYEVTFQKLVAQVKIRGFDNFGLEGQLQQYAQAIERSAYPFNKVQMNMLRRLEKDYLIQKERSDADKFKDYYYQMREELALSNQNAFSQQFDSLFTNYHHSFKELVRVEGMIGNNESGLQAQLQRYTGRMESQVHETIVKANQRSIELRHWFQGISISVISISVVMSIALSYFNSRHISRPVRSLTQQTNERLSKNFQLDTEPIQTTSNDEISTLTGNFNLMMQEIQYHLSEIKQKNNELENQNQELQAMNVQLGESEANLRKLNMVKDKFFFIISHDLKGPLNTLAGFLQVLKADTEQFSPEQIKAIGASMNTSVRSLLNLMNNLLQWAIAQTGELQVNTVKLSLTDAVNDTVELMAETARTKHIRLISYLESDFIVRSDRNMLDSVLRNLISNAIKFTHSDGEIRIKAYESQDFVEVRVEDTGVGISENDLKQLFRVDVHHSTHGTIQEKGTGFGLLLCKEFVEKNGGQITVKSQVGQGTSIIFTIPLVSVMYMA